MHLLRWLSLVPFFVTSAALAQSPAEAKRIQQEFTLKSETWELQVKTAPDAAARQALLPSRPDVKNYALQMWNAIRSSLTEEWTLQPAAWLLRVAPAVHDPAAKPTLIEAATAIRSAVEKHHLRSAHLSPICLSLVSAQDPQALNLLEKIEAENPDTKVQGAAALAQAVILKGLGDDPEVMKKRLTLIRKAIINSAEVEFAGTTVAKMAEDELYIILNLTTNRVAPDLVGTDSGNQPMTLSSYKGKIVVLIFWSVATTPDLGQFLEITRSLEKRFVGKPVVLVGVNSDPTATLHSLRADGRVTWANFSDPFQKLGDIYRVGARPLAYVLDQDRKIRYSGTPGSFVELAVDGILSPSQPAAATAPK